MGVAKSLVERGPNGSETAINQMPSYGSYLTNHIPSFQVDKIKVSGSKIDFLAFSPVLK